MRICLEKKFFFSVTPTLMMMTMMIMKAELGSKRKWKKSFNWLRASLGNAIKSRVAREWVQETGNGILSSSRVLVSQREILFMDEKSRGGERGRLKGVKSERPLNSVKLIMTLKMMWIITSAASEIQRDFFINAGDANLFPFRHG